MTTPAVIVLSQTSSRPVLVGGIPLVIRHIKELYNLGVRLFYLVGVSQVPVARHTRLPHDIVLHCLPGTDATLSQQVDTVLAEHTDLLLVRGDCLVDPRLCRELLTRPVPHWLATPTHSETTLPAAARLSQATLAHWQTAGLASWLQTSPQLRLASLHEYSPSHRGPVPFYVEVVTTPEDAVRATHTLIRAAQKHALDLPAMLLHPFFENRLVALLCNTPITPNQVSLFTGVLGAYVAWLLWSGWLCWGIALAYVVAVLDGVDGKLARTRVQTSRLGELEHVLDFFVEHSWYLAITVFLATSTHDGQLWWVGGGVMAFDLLDNLLYALGHTWFQKQLDELSPFDRGFRLIAGRRNIYVWMFFVGFWAGVPVHSLTAVCAWAGLTVVVHGVRLVYHRRCQLAVA